MINYWCMISNDAIPVDGDAISWLRTANPTIMGVCHDNVNTVYPHTPPSNLSGARLLLEPDLTLIDAETGDDSTMINELMARLASRMTAASSDILVIKREYLIRLFNTPQHRLWCANYDDDSRVQFDSDWAVALPIPQPDLPFADLQIQSRAIIKAAFS